MALTEGVPPRASPGTALMPTRVIIARRRSTGKTLFSPRLPARLLALGCFLAWLGGSPAARAGEDDPSAALSEEWWSGQISGLPFRPAEPGKRWWDEVLRAHPACRAYTDECRVCSIGPDGTVCSTVGIACVAGEWTCTSGPADAPKPP
jgi:hypothetical protein